MNAAKNSKFWAAICYIPPLPAILLFLKRKDQLVYFHAKQALAIWLLCAFAVGMAMLPGRFFALAKWPVSLTAGALFVFLLISGAVDASMGSRAPRPPLGQWVDNLAIFRKLQEK